MGRSRSAAQALLGNLAILAVAALVFAVVGSALAGTAGGAGHIFQVGGKPWNWLGAGPLLLGELSAMPAQAQLGMLFEILAVALAAMIPWGSGMDRWQLTAGCAAAAVTAAGRFRLWGILCGS